MVVSLETIAGLLDSEDRSRGVNGYEDSRASEFQAFGGDGLKEFPGLLRRLPAEQIRLEIILL